MAEKENEEENVSLISNLDWTFEHLDLNNRETAKTKSSLKEPPSLELKALPAHLKYAYLGDDNTLPMIISSTLNLENEKLLMQVLKVYSGNWMDAYKYPRN